jgi:PAS domain S-box-containing protein
MTAYSVESSEKAVVDLENEKPIRVLHVDDEASFLEVAKQCLEMQGQFNVDKASSAEEALEKLKKEKYDAVVSDYKMPGKNGLEFLKELREHGNTIPFIMFTGKGREEIAVGAWSLGADHYLNKTGNPETVYYELAHYLQSAVEKHVARAHMQETLQKLQTIYQNAFEGILYVDAEENIVYANKAFADMIGYEPDQLVNMNLRSVVDDENWAKRENEMKRRRQGDRSRYELEFRRRDGTVRNAMVSGAPLLDSDGQFRGTVGIILDITEQKKTREAMEESEERFQRIFESVDDGLISLDMSGRIIEINKKAVEFFGGSREELLGKHFTKIGIFSIKEVPTLMKTFANILRGKEALLNVNIKNKKGQAISLECTASISKSHDKSTIAVVARDTTERRERERLLRESEVKYRELAESISDVFFAMDKDFRYTYWNKASEKLTGTKAEDAIGKSLTEVFPDVKDTKVEQFYRNAMKTKQRQISLKEYQIGGKDFIFELNAYPTQNGLSVFVRDITERRKAEESVRASEERYRSYIEVTGQLGWTTNADGEVEEDIPAWRKYTGQSYEEVKGLGWTKALHPDDIEHTTQVWEKAVAEKSSYEVEYRIRRHDGVYRNFMARGVPVLEKDGKIREWVGTCIDITEHKEAEDALKDSEQKFRNLAEQSPNMIFINHNGRVVYANRKAEDVMGYKKEEYYSPDFNFLDLIAQESRELVKSAFSKHMRGEDLAPYDYKLVTKEGRTIDAIINSKLITHDGGPAILGLVTDITDRKEAERMTLESQQKFRGLFMGNPEAAVYVGPDFSILDVNPRFEELFGYSLAEIKGKRINNVVVQSDKMEEAEMLDKKAVDGYVYHSTVRRKKDGSLLPVAVSVAPILAEGKPVGYVAMYKDISDLKDAEKKLEEINEKLRVVGGLTRHDVRNKLSSVTGNAYLAKKELAKNIQAQAYLSGIESAVQQVTRIFDFATAYEKLGVEQSTYTDVEKSVEEAVSLFPELDRVRIVNETQGLTVLADSLLRQLFYNLIDNSLKHGERTTRIRIYYEKTEGDGLRLVYEDDGAGVSPDVKPRLFGEGYTTGTGSGYGLYLVKKMIEVYGWTIREEGTPGKGAQFTMTIPRIGKKGKENYQLS